MAYTTIKKPSDYFNTKLYTGNGTTDTAITGVGFQSDMTWIKSRSSATSHSLTDAVRGNTKGLYPDLTNAENSSSNYIKSFDSDGFTLGTDSIINANGATFVSWNWLANGAGSANTDGTISSTVSANTTSGFSIVSYTGNGSAGATVGHGLNVAPSMIIFKRRDTTQSWITYHQSLGTGHYLYLNSSDASSSASGDWCTPNASTFQLNQVFTATNTNTATYIAYCFAEKKGFSKFGSYTGNGSADGTFIYTGFKPAFILIKKNAVASWYINDNKRSSSGGFNVSDEYLRPNLPNGTGTDQNGGDFVSNGFKLRNADTDYNASGATYIYMAFAEEPLVGDNPCTAR